MTFSLNYLQPSLVTTTGAGKFDRNKVAMLRSNDDKQSCPLRLHRNYFFISRRSHDGFEIFFCFLKLSKLVLLNQSICFLRQQTGTKRYTQSKLTIMKSFSPKIHDEIFSKFFRSSQEIFHFLQVFPRQKKKWLKIKLYFSPNLSPEISCYRFFAFTDKNLMRS